MKAINQLNDQLLKLANGPAGPQFDCLKVFYYSAIKLAYSFNREKFSNSIDATFSKVKKNKAGKKFSSLEEFENAIINTLLLEDALNIPSTLIAELRGILIEKRTARNKFYVRYKDLFAYTIGKQLLRFPIELQPLISETFITLILKTSAVSDPILFFEDMRRKVVQLVNIKGYNVTEEIIGLPVIPDYNAPTSDLYKNSERWIKRRQRYKVMNEIRISKWSIEKQKWKIPQGFKYT
jgi:hypothetical protein